jgi:uncharacterized cupin superfamily protein
MADIRSPFVGNIEDANDFKPSTHSAGGHATSWSKPIPASQRYGRVFSGVWVAEPGLYQSSGHSYSETFVVFEGAGIFSMDGCEPVAIKPGGIVYVPSDTPSSFKVIRKVCKFFTQVFVDDIDEA